MKLIFLTFFVSFIFTTLSAQNTVFTNPEVLADSLFSAYEKYREPALAHRRFKHADLKIILDSLSPENGFAVNLAGKSVEKREIYCVKWGEGPIKVLLWSQMHGDEPTATAALTDIFRFLAASDDYDSLRSRLRKNLSLYFIPMLNPDGAERFQRQNRYGIDINRDALRRQTPEGRVLWQVRDSLEPDFGFNLHDQGRHHAAGNTDQPAIISFLAPPFNYKRQINPVRKKAMLLIAEMHEILKNYIPGQIAQYSDGFEPRAFGDNIQKAGTSTILIESGGRRGDFERQLGRKLNFTALLTAFHSISEGLYLKQNILNYTRMPGNSGHLKELKIKNLTINFLDSKFLADYIFSREEENASADSADGFYFRSYMEEVGEIRTNRAYDEYDMEGYEAVFGKVYPKLFDKPEDLLKVDYKFLFRSGYTTLRVAEADQNQVWADIPMNILVGEEEKEKPNDVGLGQNPDLVISKDGKIRYVLINGFVCDLEKDEAGVIHNALIYR